MTFIQRLTSDATSRLENRSLLVLTMLALTCTSPPASAGTISGSYLISMGESTRLLQAELRESRNEISAEQLASIAQSESCKNPSTRLQNRNRVAMMLQNTSTEANEISSYSIDIQEMGYVFGDGDKSSDGFLGSLVRRDYRTDDGVGISAQFGADMTEIVLNFTGLTAGRAAIFRLDLDPLDQTGLMFPDYRSILLGASNGNGPTQPALNSATFSMAGMPDAQTPMEALNITLDPGLVTSGQLEGYRSQSGSEMYGQSGSTEVIPEPSTAVLILAGAAGLMGISLRRTSRLSRGSA